VAKSGTSAASITPMPRPKAKWGINSWATVVALGICNQEWK